MDFIYNINLKDLFINFADLRWHYGTFIRDRAIVDIGLVAFIIYRIIVLVRDTRAWQLIKGIVFILIAAVSKQLKLNTIAYILSNTISILALAMVVVFQPELRRVLEQIGRSRFRICWVSRTKAKSENDRNDRRNSQGLHGLVQDLTGALIVIEGKPRLAI